MMKRIAVYSAISLSILLSACGTTSDIEKADADKPPSWVLTPPKPEGKLCAVGASEPAYFKEDGKEYAAENARKQLALAYSVSIKSIMVDVATGRGHDVDEAGVMEVSSWVTDAVLKESEIVAYWYDKNGIASFKRKGITYALACMPFQSAGKEVSTK